VAGSCWIHTDGGGKEYTFRRKKDAPIAAYWPK